MLREWKSGNERAADILIDRYAIRLVALVASRLNRRYQVTIDPSDIVQSAMGSFFDAAKHSRIQVSGSVSLWRLLATFARRKMARSIEWQSATKRGGGQTRVSLEEVAAKPASEEDSDNQNEADTFLADLRAELPDDLFVIVEGVLTGLTQREIADSHAIDERTVRRRLSRVREILSVVDEATSPLPPNTTKGLVPSSNTALPRVGYHEFVLGKLIGSGGFGKVYRARMQSDGRTVAAVKFLRKAFWQNEDARQTFLREINIASQIKHPGVIRYLGYGESPHGGPYVLSEWIDGRSLHDVVGATTLQFLGWLKQICQAIQAVHQAGLVHGDLTPANILVDVQDQITITDFGFSQTSFQSVSPILGGTLGFAAPEQIDPAFGLISPKTDIYAIGGIVHWHLFGRPPNAGLRFNETLSETLSGLDSELPRNTTVPDALQIILTATLRKSPADRTTKIMDIMTVLDSALNQTS